MSFTLAEYSASSSEKDPKKLIEGYRGAVQLSLLGDGQYDDEVMVDVDNQLLQHAKDSGIEMEGFGLKDDDDTQYVARHSLDTGDAEAGQAANRLRALRDPSVKDGYADRPDEYQAKLEEAQVGYEAAAPLEKREAARRNALNLGDIPFATFTNPDGTKRLELGAKTLGLAGSDKALAKVFEADPNLDRSLIPEIRRKLQTPEGYSAPVAQIERQQDFIKAFSAEAAKDPNIRKTFSELQNAINDGAEHNLDPKIEQVDSRLANSALREAFSPEERKSFLRDALMFSSNRQADFENVDANIRKTSTGQVVIPMSVMLNKSLFEKTMAEGKEIPEAQKELLAQSREAQISAYAPEAFKVIAAHDDDFSKFLHERQGRGEKNAAIFDEWVSADPKNFSNLQSAMGNVAEKPKFLVSDTVSGIWDAVKGLGATAPAAFYQLTEGLERPDKYSEGAKAAFAEAEAYQKSMGEKTTYRQSVGLSSSTGETFREIGPSMAGSLGTMAASIPAMMAGTKVGAATGAAIGAAIGAPAAGAGAAPGAAVGATVGGAIGGFTAAAAVSGGAMYRIAGAQFLNDAFKDLNAASVKKNGRPLNDAEMQSQYDVLLPIAKNSALWEAGPEAVANAVTLGAGKLLFGIGKSLTSKLTATGLKEAAEFAATRSGKYAIKAGVLGADVTSEIGTETLTQVEQNADQKKMRAIAAGRDPNAIKADWSFAGVKQAAGEVTPQTLALMSLMGGAGAGIGGVNKMYREAAEQQTKAQLFGENLSRVYDMQRFAAPVAADISTELLAPSTLAGNPSIREGVKRTLGSNLSDTVRGAITAFGEGQHDPAQTLRAAADEITSGMGGSRDTFYRNAVGTYVQMSATLAGQENPNGSATYTPQQVREISLNHALLAGLNNSVTTGAFSVFGPVGMQKADQSFTAKEADAMFKRLKAQAGNLAPAATEGLDMSSPQSLLVSSMTRSASRMGVGGEDLVNYSDHIAQAVESAYAKGGRIDLSQASKEAIYGGMLGVTQGGGIALGSDPKVSNRPRLLETAHNLRNKNAPRTAEALERFAINGIPQTSEAPAATGGPEAAQEDLPEGVPAAGDESAPSDPGVAGESAPEDVEYFNFVMGEPAAPSDPAAAPVVKSKEELDAELQGIVQRFKARKGPPIVLDPIPLEHPDRIYLDKLPLKHPDRILLDPIDVAEVAIYGRGLSDEGGRILLERVQLTRQAGPIALPPPKMDETALWQARAEGKLQNDNQQPTESPQPQVPMPAVPMPAVPGSVLAADPASEAVAAPAPTAVDASAAAKTSTLTPEARSSIDREVSSAKVELTSVAHKRAVVAELEAALKEVKVPMTVKVNGKNATAQFEESGAAMVAKLKRDKDAYKALADCLGKVKVF